MKTTLLTLVLILWGTHGFGAEARTVPATDHSIVDIYVQPFTTTMIVLPGTAHLTAVDVGDSEDFAPAWILDDHVIRVKRMGGYGKRTGPAWSNMNVTTREGHTPSFRLLPVDDKHGVDWKVFIEFQEEIDARERARTESINSCLSGLDKFRALNTTDEAELETLRRERTQLVNREQYVGGILADYHVGKAVSAPFNVVVWRDTDSTYLRSAKGVTVWVASGKGLEEVHTQVAGSTQVISPAVDHFWVKLGNKKALIDRKPQPSALEVAKN
jgi:hypothetical protein